MKTALNRTLLHIVLLLLVFACGLPAQLIYLPADIQNRYKSPQNSRNLELTNQAAQPPQQILTMSAPNGGENELIGPMLSDIISIDRAISIFSGLTRSVEEVGTRLEDRNRNTTVLAPKNNVITNLPRKPWEDPGDEEEASAQGKVSEELYRGEGGEDRAASNLRRFVEAHLIGISPWQKGKENQVKTLAGKSIWWEEEAGVKKIYPDGIEVDQVKDDVPNGQIWVIKGVINY